MTETKQFDVPEVLAALEAAVEKRGAGYVYVASPAVGMPNCLYTHKAEDDTLTPGCIVGQVYFDLTGSLVPWTEKDQNGQVDENIHTRLAFTVPAQRLLAKAQIVQDSGSTWGSALAAAKEKAAEV